MEMIRAVLCGIGYLLCCAAERVKVSKRARRTCAVIVVGTMAIGAVSFTSNALSGSGKNDVYASVDGASEEDETETEDEEDTLVGLNGIISGVLLTQTTNSQVSKIGISTENVLVGQRTSEQPRESSISIGEEVVDSMEGLDEHSWNVVESGTKMSDHDYETLLAIVEAEAGGEDMKGRILVANVIFNRVADDRFPDTITDVVWERSNGAVQFSPTIDGRINRVTISETTREAVNRAIDGEDYSKGALFFVAKSLADGENVVWFDKDLEHLFTHGVHDFYTYPDGK
ncbi:MAG: cell wall hydrolase [Lachnospiraceae bacterium]|jgi:N-acetylmuramoyl-L-alanine amidase